MTALDIFTYADQQVRTILVDGEPWFVLADLCNVLDISNPSNVAARLEPTGLNTLRLTEGIRGNPNVTIVNESNMYEVVIRSDKAEAVTFRRWITGTVLPSIRKTGGFSTAPVAEVTRRDMALAILAAEDEADRQRERAEIAESFKEAIEVNDGLTPREFHKQYLSDISERAFFEFLYSRKLLIDQRNQRVDANGNPKPGRQHSHPSYTGKEFFYLFPTLDRDGIRREKTRVRPGAPELALLAYCTRFMNRLVDA